MSIEKLRNIAIIAHVDHGKTTLVDKLLQQSGTLDRKNMDSERIMDSNDQEKERGITILAKNTSIIWQDHLINIVDTPGHADFGGEVERALSMVDSVLLLVDAVDGPMPQTRFVTQKAFEKGLKPIVVINKVDRDDARPHWVLDQVFDLFDRLGATDEQLDFPVIYASAIQGISGLEPDQMTADMTPLLEMILEKVSAPEVNVDGPLQLQISALDSNSYVGVIGIGRIKRGIIKPNDQVVVIDRDGKTRKAKILQVMGHEGLDRVEVSEAQAGSIVCITGVDKLNISDTICHPEEVIALPALSVDEPTVRMTFQVNDSPFAGLEGKFVTSRNIKERLEKELISNVALRVEQGDSPDKFIVSGRGELHLSVLIETMRREGFELAIAKPQVIQKEVEAFNKENFIMKLMTDLEQKYFVYQDDNVIAAVPPFARYAYEIWIIPKRQLAGPWQFTKEEYNSFAKALQKVVKGYDDFLGRRCPYIMGLHAAPKLDDKNFHFHMEFYPPLRHGDKPKVLAGSESMAGVFIMDVLPEETAIELRKYMS